MLVFVPWHLHRHGCSAGWHLQHAAVQHMVVGGIWSWGVYHG